MKKIDFHTHTFPEEIAKRAIEKLEKSANIISYSDGTDLTLSENNATDGISLSVVLPVATHIMQADGINAKNVKRNRQYADTNLLYFAAIHPEDSDIRTKLAGIKAAGFKGIKLHPVFQGTYINDLSYLRLIDIASELDLITVIHAGRDVSFPECDYADVKYILKMMDEVKSKKLVLAHMGGFGQWDSVESDLAGADAYLDTSFCLERIVPLDTSEPFWPDKLSKEQFLRIVNKHGFQKVLFGTDSPWSDRMSAANNVMSSGLDEEDLDYIFWKNAQALLGIKNTY